MAGNSPTISDARSAFDKRAASFAKEGSKLKKDAKKSEIFSSRIALSIIDPRPS